MSQSLHQECADLFTQLAAAVRSEADLCETTDPRRSERLEALVSRADGLAERSAVAGEEAPLGGSYREHSVALNTIARRLQHQAITSEPFPDGADTGHTVDTVLWLIEALDNVSTKLGRMRIGVHV